MITIRPADARGLTDIGWLHSRHTFSFGEYYDPEWMGFRVLRVINDDRVAPGQGFGMHPHRDMEIVTVVFDGALEHRDSLGNGEVLRPGEVQRMTAGTGIRHSEFNPSDTKPVHLLQVWLLPGKEGLAPGYEQKTFAEAERKGRLRLVASKDAREGSMTINQDASVYVGSFSGSERATHRLGRGRHAWVQVAGGSVALNGQKMAEGDGAAVSDEGEITLSDGDGAKVILFDMP